GDIGMIMARRLTLEGARVERVLEIMPFLTGLTRNYVQCLLDYDVPLQLSHTVSRILGDRRVEAVEAVRVDEGWNPVPGTEELIPCDTLLLSVGLIPENELSRQAGVALDPATGGPSVDEGFQTSVPGIFAAGNVVHVYDLVDWVTEAGYTAGRSAALYALGQKRPEASYLHLRAGENVRYVVPQRLSPESLTLGPQRLQLRVVRPIEAKAWAQVLDGDDLIAQRRLRYARPGEMITVALPGEAYDRLRGTSALTVRVTER
ncbi:MAG: FAD-dependent oxidoreductase, partial [Anaerolineae bacterium]|nr:FAD-dependent oxidoreductase [Anaerolineae bacterium]